MPTARQDTDDAVGSAGRGRPFRIDAAALESLAEVLRIMELRLSIEVEAAGLAAQRGSKARLRTIEQRLVDIDDAIGREENAVEADFAFHRAICAAADNSYFLRFLEFLGHFIIPRQSIRMQGAEQRAYLQQIQREHRAIYEAISAGNAEAARDASRVHLSGSIDRYREMAATAEGGQTHP
ncbi:MAG: FCD domain-containing protein [Geminicoccaceae bacterium]